MSEVEEYLKRADELFRQENKVEALKLLEEACERHDSKALRDRLEEVREHLSYLTDLDAYKRFYDEQQKRDEQPNVFAKMSFNLRTWTGRRTEKLLKSIPTEHRFKQIEADIKEFGIKSICDIGCYDGRYAISLGARNRGVSIVGVDIAKANIEEAERLCRFDNVTFRLGLAEEVHKAFEPGTFDMVMLFEILEHVIDMDAVLNSAMRVLKHGGLVAITVPAAPKGREVHREHVRSFNDEAIKKTFGHRKGFRHMRIDPAPGDMKAHEGAHYWNYITFEK